MKKLIERIKQWDDRDWAEATQDFACFGLILIAFLAIVKWLVAP